MNDDRTATIQEVLENAEYNALHGGEYGNTFVNYPWFKNQGLEGVENLTSFSKLRD